MVMIRIVRISARVSVNRFRIGFGWKISPVMYNRLSRMENNTEPTHVSQKHCTSIPTAAVCCDYVNHLDAEIRLFEYRCC